MSLTTVLSNTTSNNLKSTTASTLKSAASAADTSTATTGFSDMLAQSALSTVPSKTLGPETLTGTVQSTTIQTSDYVFDPLGVVGIVPESNSFLQAIRQMMGKPLETPVAQAPAADAPTPVAPPALATFGALPAATDKGKDNAVPHFQAANPWTNFVHNASKLMPGNVWEDRDVGIVTLPGMPIRATEPRSFDLNNNTASRCSRCIQFCHNKWLTELLELHCFHEVSLTAGHISN